jgi:uncharacterized membrane protein YkvA (DUF1232 family)
MVAYVLSPVDLLPDWEPLVGLLDDMTLITLGISLATRLVPREIMAEHRAVAASKFSAGRARFWRTCLIVSGIWLVLTALAVFVVIKLIAR